MRLNLARFNLTRIGKEIHFNVDAQEIVEAVAGSKLRYPFSVNANESVHMTCSVHAVLEIACAVREETLGEFTLRKRIPIQMTAREEMNAVMTAAKNLLFAVEAGVDVNAETAAGKLIHLIQDAAERMAQQSFASKLIFFATSASEIVECDTEAALTQYVVVEIAVTIPPGGELRINSDIFTARTGFENVLHAYSGGWIHLTRDVVSLVVDSGTGGLLTGEVIYNERFV